MASQHYRGHVIDVTCYSLADRIAYRSDIHVDATGRLRHSASSRVETYRSDSEAQDRAFCDARSWIEQFPLSWPFAMAGDGAPVTACGQ